MTEIISELATNAGGDLSLAMDMVMAAADAGAHTVKVQNYTLSHLNPADPQHDWLCKAHLTEYATEQIMRTCARVGVNFLSTPFDVEALRMLLRLGVTRIKVASSCSIWSQSSEVFSVIKSWPWGRKPTTHGLGIEAHLTAIPLYPTPLEAVSVAPLLDGWSDHTIGTAACKHMLSKGARIIEKHFSLPGKGRNCPWDADPAQLREIRDWSDDVQTMTTGVSTTFRERWLA